MIILANIQSFVYYILIIISFFLVILAMITPGYIIRFVLAIFALLFDVLAFSMRFYSYIFMPMVRMKNRTVVLNSDVPFVMSPSGNAIIVRKGADVYASAFVKIPVYKSATEMNDDEKSDFSKMFSRIVSMNKNITKISSQLYIINKDDYISNIRDKLNEAEDRYQKVLGSKDAKQNATERVKGEVTMWHNLYDSISKSQSRALAAYAMVTAVGGSDEEASNLALQRAEEAAVGIGTAMGINATVATGQEMLVFVEPEYAIPFSTVSEEIRGKAAEEGL